MTADREGTDRRTAIRIKDRILFTSRAIGREEFEKLTKAYNEGADYPLSDCAYPTAELSTGFGAALKRLREKDDALATVVEILDQKLGLVLTLLNAQKEGGCAAKPLVVDLSSLGLSFRTPEPVNEGTILEMDIGLLPQHLFFRCYGEVLRCIQGEKGYALGIQFVWIMEDDRERLIEHIFQRQLVQLRLRRQQKEQAGDGAS